MHPTRSDHCRRSALRQALADRSIAPHYQRIYRAHGGGPVAIEALARWSTTDGVVGPAEFLDDLVSAALGHRLADRMLMASMRDLKLMADDRLVGHDVRVHVNVSPQQLTGLGEVDDVDQWVHRHGYSLRTLAFELTDTSAPVDDARGDGLLAAYAERGVRVVLDDVGTDRASLTLLHRGPVDEIKIDRSLISGLAGSRANRAIVAGLVRMAHDLGVTVTAKGIEHAADHDAVCEMGVDLVQGFLFDRPLPIEQLRRALDVGAPPTPARRANDVGHAIGRAAHQMERLTVGFEALMPVVVAARGIHADLVAETVAGGASAGSAERWAALADEAAGFERIDRARRRLLRALTDEWDTVAGWLDEAATAPPSTPPGIAAD